MRCALFWNFTQLKMLVTYWWFGKTCRSRLEGTALPLKIRPTGFPETSVRHYHYTLRKIPEGYRFNLHRSGSLKSRFIYILHLSILQMKMFMPWDKISFGNILLGIFPYKLSTAKSCLEKHVSEKDKSLQHLSAADDAPYAGGFGLPVVWTEHLKFTLRFLLVTVIQCVFGKSMLGYFCCSYFITNGLLRQ